MTKFVARIAITADDVRELLRQFPGWEMVPNAWDGWESWRWRDTDCGAWIPVMPDTRINLTQARLWDAVRDAGVAMGIGTDSYVHLGMLLQRRLEATMDAIASDQAAQCYLPLQRAFSLAPEVGRRGRRNYRDGHADEFSDRGNVAIADLAAGDEQAKANDRGDGGMDGSG